MSRSARPGSQKRAAAGPVVAHIGPAFPVVGVGASAGGLEAFSELLRHLRPDTGFAFVLVQHLDPQHESALTQLLSRVTSLPVSEVTDNLRVQANHVYVIPPNTHLRIEQGVLKLEPRPQTRTPTRSIDLFFESLAADRRERAIGVILSGTATDGTLGLEAIKAEGGITFAQDDSARYDSMPRSAVAAGSVDFVLAPEQIAHELTRIARHPYVAGRPLEASVDPETHRVPEKRRPRGEAEGGGGRGETDGFRKVMLLLRNHSGVDFTLYKSTTIRRRIARRMVLNKCDTAEAYAAFLRGNARELDALYSDVLISVTSFFRNPEAFDFLRRKVFPKLLQVRSDDPVRVWVLGCATGQEAYSIAMTFAEAADKAPRARKLQVFATDLNDACLDRARQGLYAKTLVQDLAPERLQRFFVEEEGGYRVVKALREMVVFARQNLIDDPPFSRMDLISCRNVLIYLEQSLQKKIFPLFHYALKPGGFLFLGASESVGEFTTLFEPLDRKHKLYTRKAGPPAALQLPVKPPPAEREAAASPRRPKAGVPRARKQPEQAPDLRGDLLAEREADRISINQFAPPGVLINAELQVLQFRGPTSAYLMPPPGKASFDVLKMARDGLMLPLRAAINKAKKEKRTARAENVRVAQDGKTRTVNLVVIPLKNARERGFLILFETPGSVAAPAPRRTTRRTAKLDSELFETREYLRSLQEQHEAANEELQASNEEVQSANEELQSINEELETSQEELESSNEELTTLNEEMAHRNAELNRLNSDLVNLQTATHLAILLLGRDLTVRRFSVQAARQFNLIPGDVGRPIGNVRHNLVFAGDGREGSESPPDLEAFLDDVIASGREREREVRDREGNWYSLRARPYLTLEGQADGVVLVVLDINDLKHSEQAIIGERDYAEAILHTTHDPLLILDEGLRVERANEAFYKMFHTSPGESVGVLVYDLGNGQWKIPRLRQLLEDILPRNSVFNGFEVTHESQDIGKRTMLLNARQLRGPSGQPSRILVGIQDITEVLQFQVAARESAEKYRLLFERSPLPKWAFDLETLRFIDVNQSAIELYGYGREEFLRMGVVELCTEEAGTALLAALARPMHRPPERETSRHRKKNGAIIDVEVQGSEIELAGRRVWLANMTDITERKAAVEALRESEEALREADRRKNEFLAMLAHELRNPLAPIRNMLEVIRGADQRGDLIEQARDTMDRQVRQMTRLIDDLFDVSRISRGKIALHREPVELASVVYHAVEAARPLRESRGLDLAVTLPPEPTYVDGDSARLAQVVSNLLSNACKFTDRGGRISLAIEREGDEAVLRVRDTGIGIGPDSLPHLFEMFMQVDVSLERSGGGLGLGLTLVQKLVELHGGTVEAYSAGIGEGSEFVVRLPLLADAPTELQEVPSGEARPTIARRILIVDDNRDSTDSLARLLALAGHETVKAYDGVEAVETAATFRPDVVLLDLGLPKLNGYEAARKIRESPWGKDMKLVALTGWGQEEDRLRSAGAGFDEHLVKPVEPTTLTRLLAELDTDAPFSEDPATS